MPRNCARRDVIAHAVIREVGQRMPERRQLPVEHGDSPSARRARRSGCRADSRRGRSWSRRRAGYVRGSQSISRFISGIGSVSEARYCLLQRRSGARGSCRCGRSPPSPTAWWSTRWSARDHPVHLVVDRCRARRRDAGQRLLPEHPALDEGHDVEGPADDRLRPRTGNASAPTGTSVAARARWTRNSRSIACAEGSSFAAGPGLARIT